MYRTAQVVLGAAAVGSCMRTRGNRFNTGYKSYKNTLLVKNINMVIMAIVQDITEYG